jgi:hypothetical protein
MLFRSATGAPGLSTVDGESWAAAPFPPSPIPRCFPPNLRFAPDDSRLLQLLVQYKNQRRFAPSPLIGFAQDSMIGFPQER